MLKENDTKLLKIKINKCKGLRVIIISESSQIKVRFYGIWVTKMVIMKIKQGL